MRKFQSALLKIVRIPKTEIRAKHKRTAGRPKKAPKREAIYEPGNTVG
jgi:hypothetical protein